MTLRYRRSGIAYLLPALLVFGAMVSLPQNGLASPGDDSDGNGGEAPDVDPRPFGKGAMELGFGLGAAGGSGNFFLSAGGSFAYFVAPRLAPGLSLQYQTIFGDYAYPQSFTTLPSLKFVLIRSRQFAPYLVAAFGREFQWGGTHDPLEGFGAVDSWILGGGLGAHMGIGAHLSLNFRVMFLYYFMDEQAFVPGETDRVDGYLDIPLSIGFSVFF